MNAPKLKMVAIRRLRHNLDAGVFAVPKLQREFVWNGTKAAALMDSIARDMPIGILTLWDAPAREKVRIREHLHILPAWNARNSRVWFLIDGQQRLSVIHQAFRGETRTTSRGREVDFGRIALRANGSLDQPLFSYRKPDRESYLAAAEVFGGQWRQVARGLPRRTRRRVERIRRQVMRYKVPVLVVQNAEIEDVRDLFIRINSLGTPVNAADRAFARATKVDLRRAAVEFLAGLTPQFRDLRYEIVLQTLSLLDSDTGGVGQRAYDAAVKRWERWGESEEGRAFQKQWQRFTRAMSKAIDYLAETFGVRGVDALPSAYMVSVLTVFFYHGPLAPSTAQRTQLRRWFWATAVGQRYSGRGFGRNIVADAMFVKRLAGNGANRQDRHHIYPRALLLRKLVSPRHVNSVVNMCFLAAEENQSVGSRPPYSYLGDLRSKRFFRSATRSQLIPAASSSGLWDHRIRRGFRQFLDDRLMLLCKALEDEADGRLFRRGSGRGV